jgi:hypothetical protein
MATIHPDAIAHHRKRWLRHDAYRFAPPGSPEADPGLSHPWAEVARREQAAADGAKARALAEQDEFEREVLALRAANARVRIMLADLKFELALRALGRKYSPDQPRVPAGNPDGGQWTDGGGEQSRDERVVLSDASPDPVVPGAQYAAARSGYRVDLLEEESRGGHTMEKHVNRSPEALIAQVREIFDQRPHAHDVRSGSFPSIEAATKLVSSTLAQNQTVVDRIASGELTRALVISDFGSVTGTEAVMATSRSQPYFQDTYRVGAVIVHDPLSPSGYRIISAFPTNRRLP